MRADCKKLFESGEHRQCVYFNDLKFPCWLADCPPKNSKAAYFAYFAAGATSTELKHKLNAVRLIRDASDQELIDAFDTFDGRFALTPCKSAVIDRLTGIAWARKVILPKTTWTNLFGG